MDDELTDFQKNCEGRLRERLLQIGKSLENRSTGLVRGLLGATDTPEYYLKARVSNTALTVFIYEDSAEISGPGMDDRFERVEFATPDELAQAFVAKVVGRATERA